MRPATYNLGKYFSEIVYSNNFSHCDCLITLLLIKRNRPTLIRKMQHPNVARAGAGADRLHMVAVHRHRKYVVGPIGMIISRTRLFSITRHMYIMLGITMHVRRGTPL